MLHSYLLVLNSPGICRGFLLILCMLALGCSDEKQQEQVSEQVAVTLPHPKPESPSADDYVGSSECKRCHSKIYEQYQKHPMAHSFSSVADSPIEDYANKTTISPPGSREYGVARTGDQVVHNEVFRDEEGELYRVEFPVQWAIGSGKRGRSYAALKSSRLFLSSVSWYSQENCWDLSPGYSPANHAGFTREVTTRCLSCHAGIVNTDPAFPDRFGEPPVKEAMISCERCHGPGRDHVDFRTMEDPPDVDDPIVNPKKLEPELRESVCNQCHLQGETVLRYGRKDLDFRPGEHIGSTWTFFHNGTRIEGEETKAVSQVQQMKSSKCYTSSQGKLGCISCHDPHSVPEPEEFISFYRGRCNTCHQPEDCSEPLESRHKTTKEDSCIVCHMPKLGAGDVPHTTQTDHRIIRSQGEINLNSSPGFEIFEPLAASISEEEDLRARGIVLSRFAKTEAEWQGVLDLINPVSVRFPFDPEHLVALAHAYEGAGDPILASVQSERAMFASSKHQQAVLEYLLMQARMKRYDSVLQVSEHLIKLNSELIEAHLVRAEVLFRKNRFEDALAASKEAAQIDPSRREVYNVQFEIAKAMGDQEAQAKATNALKRIDAHRMKAREQKSD